VGREFTVYHFEGGEGQLWLCALGVAVLEPSIDEMLKVGPATGDPVTWDNKVSSLFIDEDSRSFNVVR